MVLWVNGMWVGLWCGQRRSASSTASATSTQLLQYGEEGHTYMKDTCA